MCYSTTATTRKEEKKKTGIQCYMYGVENEIGFSCISNGDMKYNNVSILEYMRNDNRLRTTNDHSMSSCEI